MVVDVVTGDRAELVDLAPETTELRELVVVCGTEPPSNVLARASQLAIAESLIPPDVDTLSITVFVIDLLLRPPGACTPVYVLFLLE